MRSDNTSLRREIEPPDLALQKSVVGELLQLPSLEALERDWRTLEADADASFFLGWGWLGPWIRTVADHHQTRLFRVRRGDQTIALAFVHFTKTSRRRGLLRVRQAQLNEVTSAARDMIIEYNGILCPKADESEAWRQFAQALDDASDPWDELACRSLAPETFAAASAALSGMRHEFDREFPAWSIPLTLQMEGEEALLGAFRKKTRQQMRQSLRAFAEFGVPQLTIAEDVTSGWKMFEEMSKFHAERWARVGKTGSFANPVWVAFHRDVIASGIARGDVVVARVAYGAERVGYIYGFRHGTTFLALQTGFRPFQASALRAGYVSHFLLMQWLAARGVTSYDFLPDQENSYKRLLAEPGPPAASVRFQRGRAKFVLERLAARAYRAFRPRADSFRPSPALDHES